MIILIAMSLYATRKLTNKQVGAATLLIFVTINTMLECVK